jgi:hypothetical protein
MDADRLILELASMQHNKLQNYIVPGVTSSLIGGPGGSKVRLFHATRDATDFVTPHSHRFNFTALVLAGEVENTIYARCDDGGSNGDEWCLSTIDQVCGADGLRDYHHLRDTVPTRWMKVPRYYKKGQTYSMDYREIHSIVFDKGTVVLFFEGPQVSTTSVMLEPWVNGKCVPTFRTEPWMFEKVQP